jgi:hypothetical protein
MLADRAYAVLQPNFRGSTGYGRTFVEKGYGQWGLAMQDDLDDGMDWVVKQGIAGSQAHLHHGCFLWGICGHLGCHPQSGALSLRD